MIYDLNKPLDRDRFAARVQHLMDRSAMVEMTEKAYRTGNQNRYLHALIGAVALEVGETLDYVKRVYYKTTANYSLFVMTKEDKLLGEQVTVLRSSADLTKEEMNASITRFKIWAAKEGIYLPEPIEARPKGKGWKWIAEELCWVRLRKLTPKECFRLMDVSEDGIDKIQTAIFPDKKSVIPIGYGVPDTELKQTRISDSQQYKMAGNSIVVACLSGIFENLFTQEEVIKETLF